MEATTLSEARVYVGTYAKYNNGSLYGAWLDLSDLSLIHIYTRSCSVKDTHTRHADEDSIINEIGDGLQRFVATHATDINVLLEM